MTPADLRHATEAALHDLDLLGADVITQVVRTDALVAILDLIPPSTSEIIAALKRGDDVAEWSPTAGRWLHGEQWVSGWRMILEEHGDQRQPGYRIVRGEG